MSKTAGSMKQPYQKASFWEKHKPWEGGQYTPEGVKYWENFLKEMKNREKKKGGDFQGRDLT